MDTKDWVLLFGAAALGYVLNVVANFTSGPIGSVAGKLRGSFIERNRKAAKANYRSHRGWLGNLVCQPSSWIYISPAWRQFSG